MLAFIAAVAAVVFLSLMLLYKIHLGPIGWIIIAVTFLIGLVVGLIIQFKDKIWAGIKGLGKIIFTALKWLLFWPFMLFLKLFPGIGNKIKNALFGILKKIPFIGKFFGGTKSEAEKKAETGGKPSKPEKPKAEKSSGGFSLFGGGGMSATQNTTSMSSFSSSSSSSASGSSYTSSRSSDSFSSSSSEIVSERISSRSAETPGNLQASGQRRPSIFGAMAKATIFGKLLLAVVRGVKSIESINRIVASMSGVAGGIKNEVRPGVSNLMSMISPLATAAFPPLGLLGMLPSVKMATSFVKGAVSLFSGRKKTTTANINAVNASSNVNSAASISTIQNVNGSNISMPSSTLNAAKSQAVISSNTSSGVSTALGSTTIKVTENGVIITTPSSANLSLKKQNEPILNKQETNINEINKQKPNVSQPNANIISSVNANAAKIEQPMQTDRKGGFTGLLKSMSAFGFNAISNTIKSYVNSAKQAEITTSNSIRENNSSESKRFETIQNNTMSGLKEIISECLSNFAKRGFDLTINDNSTHLNISDDFNSHQNKQ